VDEECVSQHHLQGDTPSDARGVGEGVGSGVVGAGVVGAGVVGAGVGAGVGGCSFYVCVQALSVHCIQIPALLRFIALSSKILAYNLYSAT
jgi:hypothetical protein